MQEIGSLILLFPASVSD